MANFANHKDATMIVQQHYIGKILSFIIYSIANVISVKVEVNVY